MPVNVVWDDDEKTIIRQIYTGTLVLQDYYQAIDLFVEMVESVPHTVHSILDRQDVYVIQGSIMNALRYGNAKMPNNVGIRVVIKPSAMTMMLISIGKKIAPRLMSQIHVVNSLEDAYAVIAREVERNSVRG